MDAERAEALGTEDRSGWVYLDHDAAATHPDYGVYGGALALLGVLFIGPMALIWQDVLILFGPYDRPPQTWILLTLDIGLLGAAWTACRLLGGERPDFFHWFWLCMLIAICSAAAFVSLCLFDVRPVLPFGVLEPQSEGWRAIMGRIPPIVVWGIGLRLVGAVLAAAYVAQSRRLNVTLAKRVLASDPFFAGRAGPLRGSSRPTPRPPEAHPAQTRPGEASLRQLNAARAAGLISELEHAARRRAIDAEAEEAGS